MAKALDLTNELKKLGNDFGIVFPKEIDSKIWNVDITEQMLINGDTLADMKLPKGLWVIIIKRKKQTHYPQ